MKNKQEVSKKIARTLLAMSLVYAGGMFANCEKADAANPVSKKEITADSTIADNITIQSADFSGGKDVGLLVTVSIGSSSSVTSVTADFTGKIAVDATNTTADALVVDAIGLDAAGTTSRSVTVNLKDDVILKAAAGHYALFVTGAASNKSATLNVNVDGNHTVQLLGNVGVDGYGASTKNLLQLHLTNPDSYLAGDLKLLSNNNTQIDFKLAGGAVWYPAEDGYTLGTSGSKTLHLDLGGGIIDLYHSQPGVARASGSTRTFTLSDITDAVSGTNGTTFRIGSDVKGINNGGTGIADKIVLNGDASYRGGDKYFIQIVADPSISSSAPVIDVAAQKIVVAQLDGSNMTNANTTIEGSTYKNMDLDAGLTLADVKTILGAGDTAGEYIIEKITLENIPSQNTSGEKASALTLAEIGASTALNVASAWRADNNDLLRRMGDLRTSSDGAGVWVRMYGGKSTSGDATYNSIVVSAGKMSRVFGGNSNKGVAKNNSVNISGGEITGSVYGGNSDEGSAAYNSVIIGSDDGGDTVPAVGGDVYGGYTEGTESAEYNQVIIKSGTMGEIDGGYSYKGDAIGNKVYINGGEMSTVYGGDSSSGDATGNKVYISGDSTINGSVYGGDNSSTGAVIDNEVYISGGTMSFVFGGYSYKGDATGNKVYISGGEVDGVYGGNSSDGNATDNKVYISGGKVYGEIYGGMSSSGAATGNTITISGTPVFEENYTVLYGGYSNSGEVSGNTLNFNSKGLAVANVKNFDVYNFYLPDTVQANDTLLTLTDGAGDGTDLTGSTVNVEGRLAGTSSIQNNDRLVLLANSGSEINAGGRKELGSGEIMQGVSVVYDYITRMSSDNKQVLVEFTNGKATAQSKSPVETQLAAAAFINSGADTVAGSGIASAVQVAGSGSAEMFGAMSGGSMRYKSGSYADVQGYNMALGLAKAVDNNAGKLTYGSLLEYGWGNYTSHLDSGIRADGNTKYYGIGLLARQDNKSGVYYEGSLRYGRMDADYASNDLGTAGVHSSYDSSSAYYGAHLGIGKVTELNDTTKADVYAKLLYTHQNGDSVTLQGEGNGEEYDFDAVDSTRARVGARVSKAYSERGTGYVGLAYEYEFDGEARATVKGFSTPSPSIKGSSGLLELGYILQPKGVNDPTINIGLQGWGGKKQGVTGNVNFVWTF